MGSLLAVTDDTSQGIDVSWHHTWPLPLALTVALLLAAVALVVLVYLCQRGPSWRVRLSLAAIRISLLGLLLFMMYGWMLHRQRTDQADLVLALDVSESMSVQDQFPSNNLQSSADQRVQRVGLNTTTRFNLGKSLLLNPDRGWLVDLADRYHLKTFYLGNEASPQSDDLDALEIELRQRDATDGDSRLGIGLLQILQSQRGRPTAAVVILTDGATTSGATLAEAAEVARKRNVPLFLVGIGNETPPSDASVSDLLTDDVVFVDDVVNFDFTVRSRGYAGQPATVQLRDQASDAVLAEQMITLAPDDRPESVRLTHRPTDVGVVNYVVELLPLQGELNVDNNRLTKRIDVRDATISVLIVQAYPNYEFRSLKDLLGRAVKSARNPDKAIELTTILQTADIEHAEQDATARTNVPLTRNELSAFDVIIFGDVNPAFLSHSIMENLAHFVTDHGGGLIFLAGGHFTPKSYRDTPLAPLFPYAIESARAPNPDTLLSESFRVLPTPLGLQTPFLQLGDSLRETETIWNDLDAMFWLYETPDVKPAARLLAAHPSRVGDQAQPMPAILMQFVGAGKVVAHNIDETYLWSRDEQHRRHYARYWLQMLRYLSRGKLLSDDQPVRIVTDRAEYQSGEPVRVTVKLAPALDGFDQDVPVTLMIQHEHGARRELVLARDEVRGTFAGSIIDLESGTHRIWLAAPQLTPPPDNHSIRVASPRHELTDLQMNAADLRLAAKRSQGRFYSIHTADRLPRDLPRGRQVPLESLPSQPVWNSPMIAGLFVLLITLEWLLRKRVGMI